MDAKHDVHVREGATQSTQGEGVCEGGDEGDSVRVMGYT